MTAKNGSVKQPDKLQPHNIEAEEAVIGALLIDQDAILRVNSWLKADMFFLQRHGWIYDTLLSLHSHRQPLDLVTINDELERRGRLADLGGPGYLTDLINSTPTSVHVEYYGRIVERTFVLRRMISGASQIARLAYEDQGEVDDLIDRAEQIIYGVSEKRITRDLKPARIIIERYYDLIEYRSQRQGETFGIPSGIKDLDELLGGFQRSDLIVIAGRPGMGKTSLAISAAHQATKQFNKRVAIFSLEMSDEQVIERLAAAETGIDSQRLRLGKITESEWPRFLNATSLIADWPLYVDDTPAISVMELRSKARRLEAEHGLDMIIVDYMQLMRGDNKSENRQQEISFISRSLKELARELNIPVLALSQLNRSVESRADKRPMLSDLRESGSIEQDADIVMFVYRDDVYNAATEFPNIAEIIIGKHRHGPTGIFSVYFKKALAQFVGLEVNRQPLDYR